MTDVYRMKEDSELTTEELLERKDNHIQSLKKIGTEHVKEHYEIKSQLISFWKELFEWCDHEDHKLLEHLEKIIIRFYNDKDSMKSILHRRFDYEIEKQKYFKDLRYILHEYLSDQQYRLYRFTKANGKSGDIVIKVDGYEERLETSILIDWILLEIVNENDEITNLNYINLLLEGEKND